MVMGKGQRRGRGRKWGLVCRIIWLDGVGYITMLGPGCDCLTECCAPVHIYDTGRLTNYLQTY